MAFLWWNWPEYPGCTPSWLHTESWQNPHESHHNQRTGIRAAKRAARKRRRSRK